MREKKKNDPFFPIGVETVAALSNIFGTKKPLGKLFKTEYGYYLYDSGTSQILNCDELTYDLLQNLFSKEFKVATQDFIEENGEDCFIKTASTLLKSISRHILFAVYEVKNFDLFPRENELAESIDGMCNMMELEVTERCNLRCLYCVYNKENSENRNHSNKDMKVSTALAAIDYLKSHSKKSQEVNIVFFGGEPFVNFPLIKRSIEYAKKIFTDQEVSFSVTTNATLITPEISRFLALNNVNVTVSIDGPQEIHDRYRKNSQGKGSFKDALRGLKYLYEAYGDWFTARVRLHMVYTPPFSSGQINKRANFWKEVDWLPHDLPGNIVYYSGPRLSNVSHKEDKNLMQWAFREYIEKKQNNEKPHPLTLGLIEKPLAIFAQRTVYRNAAKEFTQNGCCIPGVRRILVTTSGDFRLCEQISIGAPTIGNVKKGVDLESLYQVYHNDYKSVSLPICKRCWAINICDSCFIDAFDDKGISYNKKVEKCTINRSSLEMTLYYFSKALETMPSILDHLQSIELK